jgi:hypothetical protein
VFWNPGRAHHLRRTAGLGLLGMGAGPPLGRSTRPQKKWFQVIRFTAWLATGMHRTEHCVGERRVPGCSAPPAPVSPAPGSMLPSAPQPANASP